MISNNLKDSVGTPICRLHCFFLVILIVFDRKSSIFSYVGETSYIKDAKVRAVLTPKYKPYRDDLVIRDYTDSDFDDVWAITGWKFPMMEANKYQVKVIDRSGFPVGIIFRGMHLGEA